MDLSAFSAVASTKGQSRRQVLLCPTALAGSRKAVVWRSPDNEDALYPSNNIVCPRRVIVEGTMESLEKQGHHLKGIDSGIA